MELRPAEASDATAFRSLGVGAWAFGLKVRGLCGQSRPLSIPIVRVLWALFGGTSRLARLESRTSGVKEPELAACDLLLVPNTPRPLMQILWRYNSPSAINMYMHMHICIYVCIYVYIYIYTHL